MREGLHSALTSLGSNRLRTTLTIAIMATGITALVGIQTAIDVLSSEVSESFGRMGASTFSISPLPPSDTRESPPLTYNQARQFASGYRLGLSSVSSTLTTMASASVSDKKSDPVLSLVATDGNYLSLHGASIESGRTFTASDIDHSSQICIIGANVRKKLFAGREAVGEFISVGPARLQIIGVAAYQGSMPGSGTDAAILVPASTAYRFLSGDVPEFTVTVLPFDSDCFSEAMDEARTYMRQLRRISAGNESDFSIQKSDAAQSILSSLKSKLSLLALVIGLITLTGAAVALMNIMLVSVKERTREIGLRKAIGAGAKVIEREFLTEALLIGEAGGAAGIILGIGAGNIVAVIMEGNFTVPWRWIAASVVICMAVSLLSGFLPARRAASMNPIEALREER